MGVGGGGRGGGTVCTLKIAEDNHQTDRPPSLTSLIHSVWWPSPPASSGSDPVLSGGPLSTFNADVCSGGLSRGCRACTRSFSSDLSLPQGATTLICRCQCYYSDQPAETNNRLTDTHRRPNKHTHTHICV